MVAQYIEHHQRCECVDLILTQILRFSFLEENLGICIQVDTIETKYSNDYAAKIILYPYDNVHYVT